MPGKFNAGPRGFGRKEKRAINARIRRYAGMLGPKSPKETVLTKLVCKQAEKLPVWEKEYFAIYREADLVEHIDNGTPFVVVDDLKVQVRGGFCIEKLSRPVILVSSKLYPAERKAMAQYLYTMWSVLRSKGRGAMKEAMLKAEKEMNPDLLRTIREEVQNRRVRVISGLKKIYLNIWRKNKINKAKFKAECQDVISGRKNRKAFVIDGHTFVVQYNRDKGLLDVYMAPHAIDVQYFNLKAGYVPGSDCHLGSFAIKQPS